MIYEETLLCSSGEERTVQSNLLFLNALRWLFSQRPQFVSVGELGSLWDHQVIISSAMWKGFLLGIRQHYFIYPNQWPMRTKFWRTQTKETSASEYFGKIQIILKLLNQEWNFWQLPTYFSVDYRNWLIIFTCLLF